MRNWTLVPVSRILRIRSALNGLAVVTLSSLWLPAMALDYPRWRGPDLNGISKETGWASIWPQSGPKTLWKANVGIGYSSIAVSQDRAFTMGNKSNVDSVYCFDAASGKEVWKHTYEAPLDAKYYEGGTSATPTVEADRVYTLSKRGLLHCLETATGKVLWVKDVPKEVAAKNPDNAKAKVPEWGFAGSVLVYEDRLYVNVGRLGSCLDREGNVVWTTGPQASGYSTHVPFAMGSQKGLAVFAAQAVAAVDPTTGKELWSHAWKTSYDVNAADPIIQGNRVFISSGYNKGAALLQIDGDKPTVVWENKSMRNMHNNCVLLQDHLYGFDGDSNSELKCLELQTGNVKWTEKGLGKGALMAADGKLVILSEKGELVIAAADPSGFKASARAQVLGGKCWTTPVLSQGRVYARNAAGDVVCVDVSGK